MSYILTEKNGKKCIVETQSDTRITFTKKSEKELRNITRKLNLGSGFNGWTPQFFASSGVYDDINISKK